MIRLRLLGRVELRDANGDAVHAVVAQPRRLALLAYIALADHSAPRRRDSILGLFWPDRDDDSARGALNKAIHFLRKALGPDAILTHGAQDLAVNPVQVWCDALHFREAMRANDYALAMGAWMGDVMPGFYIQDAQPFEVWLETERAAFRRQAGAAARQVAASLERDGDVAGAVIAARQGVELMPDDERAVRELIELLDRLGDRAGALTAYKQLADRLAAEFAVEPAAETRALIMRVRARDSVRTSVERSTR